jgi:transcriptional regulator with XRE-family HTH domain
MDDIKNKIREWIASEERSQAYLARKIGMSEEHISRLLNGRHKPNKSTVDKILELIN